MRTNKPLLLVAIILMIPAIILALKVEPTSDEQITAVVFGILSAIVSYLSRDKSLLDDVAHYQHKILCS